MTQEMASVNRADMPKLQPLPIITKSASYPVALWRWLFTIRRWTLLEDWRHTLPGGQRIVIPAGFEFDGASIPRNFWGVLSPTGLLLVPGLIHDYAYEHAYLWQVHADNTRTKFGEGKGRLFWDALFRDVAIQVNGFVFINLLAWIAVVLFGWWPWGGHRRAERREAARQDA